MGSQDAAIRNIRRLLRQRGWSGNRLADFAGVSRGYVADLLAARPLRGGKEPPSMSLRILDRLAEALEIPASDLIKGTAKGE